MIRLVRRHRTAQARGDEGIAMVVSISLIGLVGILALALVAVAMYETRATGRDRQRSVAVMTAEGTVDSLIAAIQSTDPASLGALCGTITPATTSVISDTLESAATVTYSDAGGNTIDCAALPTSTAVAQAAVKVTTRSEPVAGAAAAERTVETLIKLTPSYGNNLDKAIFGNAGVTLANHADVYGQNGQPDADVYTNGNVTCSNNQHFYGSIYAQGTVRLENTCTVEVDVHAKDGIQATHPNVTINGRALVSNGNITLNNAQVGQQARASGTVIGSICSTANKCFPGVSVPVPQAQSFPVMKWDAGSAAKWYAEGYTNVVTFSGAGQCGMFSGPGPLNGKVDMVGKWIVENMATLTTPTVVVADCPGQPVKLQGVGFDLNSHLAIFSTGGVNFSGNSQIKSTTSDSRYLYLIQPYDAKPLGCNEDGISLDNQVTVHSTVDMLLYSPCNVRKANNTTHYGQIYAGGIAKIDNHLTMYYQPLPAIGVDTASSTIEGYDVDILYKRENR